MGNNSPRPDYEAMRRQAEFEQVYRHTQDLEFQRNCEMQQEQQLRQQGEWLFRQKQQLEAKLSQAMNRQTALQQLREALMKQKYDAENTAEIEDAEAKFLQIMGNDNDGKEVQEYQQATDEDKLKIIHQGLQEAEANLARTQSMLFECTQTFNHMEADLQQKEQDLLAQQKYINQIESQINMNRMKMQGGFGFGFVY